MRRPFPPSKLGRRYGVKRVWKALDGKWYSDTHKGDDYPVPEGTPIPASSSGFVVMKGFLKAIGYFIGWKVDGIPGLVWRDHMLEEPSELNIGDRVTEGKTIVGKVGMSGSSATGPHLHEQAELNGVPVSPSNYYDAIAGISVTPFDPQKDTRTIMALKDTLTIYSAPGRGYLVVGPSFTREIIGNERLSTLSEIVGIEGIAVSTRAWDVIAEFFRGNDELQGRATPSQIEQVVRSSLGNVNGKVDTDDLVADVVTGVRDLFAKAGS